MTKNAKQCMSLSALFLTILAIYVTVILLCFQSTEWPHASIIRSLLAPLHASQSASHSLSTPATALSLHEPLNQPAANLPLRKPALDNTDTPPPLAKPTTTPQAKQSTTPTPTPTPTPTKPFKRTNNLPESSSFSPPPPARDCGGAELQSRPELRYTLHTALIDNAQLGPAINVTLYQLCVQPWRLRVNFRLYVTGVALAAAPGVVELREGEWVTSGVVRVPDAGVYMVVCRLQAVNVSADMVERDWPYKIPLQYSDIPGQEWNNRDIHGSPVTDIVIPPSSYERHRPLTYAALQTTPPAQQPLPLCWSHAASPQLDGRWVLGPRHDHIDHPYPSTSIFDDYAAIYAPYDCAIDYTARFLPALHSLRWMHVIGDSNMRALFIRLCEAAGGTMYNGSPALGGWDLPRLCTVPRDVNGDGVMVDNATVITYTNWFYVKALSLDVNMTFASHCTRYTEDTKEIERLGLNYGWPECHNTHPSVYQLHQPSLTYFGWGNHQAEMGASDATRRYLRDTLFGHPYWRTRHALIAYTEDTDPSRMQGGPKEAQFVFRNNPRVQAVNAMMRAAVEESVAEGRWRDGHEAEGGGGRRGWLPIFDAFSVTHAGSEVLHGDTVHFWPELEKELVKLVAHYITHAPQLQATKELMRRKG